MPGQVIVGLMLSETSTSKLQVAVFEDPSVAVNTMLVVPTATTVPGAGTWLTVTSVQLSVAVAKEV